MISLISHSLFSHHLSYARSSSHRLEQLERALAGLKLSDSDKRYLHERLQVMDSASVNRKITVTDFDTIAIIGRGAFGEVRVVRKKDDGKVYAMKIMRKSEMLKKNQVEHIRAERDVLALVDSPWVVKLHYSFQTPDRLYLVMEFLQGGDFMSILMKYDTLSEAHTAFYIAETALAINDVHRLNYIHRDLKPDNILIAKDGHVKLSDFGLCKSFGPKPVMQEQFVGRSKPATSSSSSSTASGDVSGLPSGNVRGSSSSSSSSSSTDTAQGTRGKHRDRKLAYSTVGTPDYIAPEVFAQTGYDERCDWWSLGVILYETLMGYPPFYADDPMTTCQKILNWRKTLHIPRDAGLSPIAVDLISRLICDVQDRLTFDQLQAHPFFRDIDWKSVRNSKPPLVAPITSDIDVSQFDKFEPLPDEVDEVPSGDATGATGAHAAPPANAAVTAGHAAGGDEDEDEDGDEGDAVGDLPARDRPNKGKGKNKASTDSSAESNPFYGYTYKEEPKSQTSLLGLFQ